MSEAIVEAVVSLPRFLVSASLATAIVAAGIVAGANGAVVSSSPSALRSVLLVGNNWDGTVDVIDPATFDRIDRIDVAPDYQGCVAPSYPIQDPPCVLGVEADGTLRLVDDLRVSPDGRTIYLSRPSLDDAAAIDIVTGRILWRTRIPGTDHIALSPDGSRLLVSAKDVKAVEVVDTGSGAIVDEIPTGDIPHGNEYSEDGTLAFNGSMGRTLTADLSTPDAVGGDRWLTIIDADTLDVIKQIDFGAGVRPFVVLPDNRTMYVQLSFFNGLVEYDLEDERVLRTVSLPLSEEARRQIHIYRSLDSAPNETPLDEAHHGIALNGDRTKICAAGTISDYVAILSRPPLTVDRIIPVGDKPYWATSSVDGRFCFVAISDSDEVSVISYDRAAEVARIPVGDHPQRMRAVSMVVR
jgi:DNA-binding beta-propeller fold protein YncE